MTQPHDHRQHTHEPNRRNGSASPQGHAGHEHTGPEGGGHKRHSALMMIACCVPMLAIAIVLVATGVVGVSFLFIAVACTLMMAMMHGGGGHGGHGGHGGSGARDYDR